MPPTLASLVEQMRKRRVVPKLAATFAAAKLAAGGGDLHVASLCVGPVAAAR